MPAELRVATNVRLSGPWLIDRDQLEKLDKIIDEIFQRITARNNTLITQRVEQEYEKGLSRWLEWHKGPPTEENKEELRKQAALVGHEYPHNISKRDVVIDIGKDKKLMGESIADIRKQPDAHEVIATSLRISVQVGDFSCEMSISAPILTSTLDISVRPENDSYSYEAFASLRDWAIAAQAPRWQQTWRSWSGFHWVFVVPLIFMTIALIDPRVAQSPYVGRAHEILRDGVNEKNTSKAIETVLALQSGYIPPGTITRIPSPWQNWGLLTVATLLILGFAIQICPPHVLVDFGVNPKRLNRWRRWAKFVSISVPTFLLVDFGALMLLDRILQWAKSTP